MTTPADEHEQLDRAERTFVAQLARHYAPAPLTPNQRAAFDLALEARIEKRRRRWTLLVPAVATIAAAATVLVFTLSGRLGLAPSSPAGLEGVPGQSVVIATAPSKISSAPSLAETGPEQPQLSLSPDQREQHKHPEHNAIDDWEYDLLAFNMATYEEEPEDFGQDGLTDEESPLLPDDYLAIESVFFEG